MWKIRLNLRNQQVVIFSVIILVTSSILSISAINSTWNKIETAALTKLRNDVKLAQLLFDVEFPGTWEIKDNRLYKGNHLVNLNYYIVDKIGSVTGDTAAVFLGNNLVNTNIKQADGSRLLEIKVPPEVFKKVSIEGKDYLGKARAGGIENYTFYTPIINSKQKIIGIIYVGVPNAPYQKMIWDFIVKLIILTVALIGLGILAAFYFARSLNIPLQQIVSAIDRAGNGDLQVTLNIQRCDELGKLATAFNQMMNNIRKLISQIQTESKLVNTSSQQLTQTSEQIAFISGEIATHIQKLAAANANQSEIVTVNGEVVRQVQTAINHVAGGAQDLFSKLSATGKVIENMNRSLGDIATNSQEVASIAAQAVDTASDGEILINKAVDGIAYIKEQVVDSARTVSELGQRSQEIDNIVQVISDITDQTNLLALNAAIEAARAGDQGKGFAVVADEVRKLAERSGQSARQIKTLVEGIQQETQRAVVSMNEGTTRVEKGVGLIQEVGTTLRNILSTVRSSNKKIQNITSAVEQIAGHSREVVEVVDEVVQISESTTSAIEQIAAGSGEITQAMMRLEEDAIQNTSDAEEVAASTEELNATTQDIANAAQILSAMSSELSQMVDKFKV